MHLILSIISIDIFAAEPVVFARILRSSISHLIKQVQENTTLSMAKQQKIGFLVCL
jgi:hypothetical protein